MDKVIRVFENPEITRELNKNKVKLRKAHVFYVQVKYQLLGAVDTIFQSLWLLSGFSWQRVAANKETTESRVPIVKLKSLLWKFYGRQHDLVNCYGTSVSQMTTDMFHLSLTLLTLPKHLSSPPVFSGVCFTRSLVLCVMFCRSLFVLFLLAIMLSVHLRFTDSDYHFGIFITYELWNITSIYWRIWYTTINVWWRGVLDTTLCDKVCQWPATGRRFSPVSSTNKTDRHDITEILLKVALCTINNTNQTTTINVWTIYIGKFKSSLLS